MKNMPSYLKLICFLFLSLVLLPDSFGQDKKDSSTIYEIITKDGNKYYGKISAEDSETITLETKNVGSLTIKKSTIKSKLKVNAKKFQDGEYWGPNPQANRYFWAPNAYSLRKGEGYYQNVWVFFNQASYGVTDNFTMGVGLFPTFLVGAEATPIWFTPKVSIPIKEDKFSLGVGALAVTILGDEIDNAFAGITYGVATIGSRDANFSLGLGYGFVGGDWADTPTVTISGMLRMNKRTYLMTENYIIGSAGSNVGFSIVGARTVWDNISLDYGLLVPLVGEGLGLRGIPWLGLVIPFGNRAY